jgi:uridine phosphorylase
MPGSRHKKYVFNGLNFRFQMALPAKNYKELSVFKAGNLLREARRQKALPDRPVPGICLLDPDGDIVRCLVSTEKASKCLDWACYHTDLYISQLNGVRFGVIGCAVGAPFAVLVAEELFASGCKLIVSISSAGQLSPIRKPPYFVLITKALRDEGTSYHYLAPSEFSSLHSKLKKLLKGAFESSPAPVEAGATWTTDAPFRETASAVSAGRDMRLLAVEMEAAALYAFAKARKKPVICFAHVTNQMASIEGDFEKGAENGCRDALWIFTKVARLWRCHQKSNL